MSSPMRCCASTARRAAVYPSLAWSRSALPEADVTRSDIQVARESREVVERRRDDLDARPELEIGIDVPAVQDRDAGADVADGDHEVDASILRARDSLAARNREPDVVVEPDLDRRVFGARRNDQRALSSE